MPGFTLVQVRAAVRKLIRDTGTTRVFPDDPDFDDPFIRQAVHLYSQRKPRRVPFFELSLLAGTGEYALPADWLRRDDESWRKAFGQPAARFQYEPYPGVQSSLQVSPYPPAWLPTGGEVRFLDEEQRLVIHPAPQHNATLVFDYLGLHSVSEDAAAQTTVGALHQDVIEKLSAATVLEAIAIEQAMVTKYKLARGLEVDNSKVAEELKKSAETYRSQALNALTGPVLMRG